MTDAYEEVEIVEVIDEVPEHEPVRKMGCRKAIALLLALTLLFSAAVPLVRFLFRKSYERQVEAFPNAVCDNIAEAGLSKIDCQPILGVVEFVPRTFSMGQSKRVVGTAMKNYPVQIQTGVSQPGCQQPELWTYSVAKSFLGWQTEIEFLFCSDLLVERTILLNGRPVALPTYDL